jgi:hypothetical protein
MKELFHYNSAPEGRRRANVNSGPHKDLTNTCNIVGDCSDIWGDCRNITGNVSTIVGDISGLSGDCTDIFLCFPDELVVGDITDRNFRVTVVDVEIS